MEQHTLILLRHGKSDWSAGENDFNRPLKKRGEKSVPKVGKWLKENGPIPERIIASPAKRAWRTAELMAGALGMDAENIIPDARIYEDGLEGLKEVIESRAVEASCVMLVGHNPALDELLLHLSSSPPPRDESGKLMTTAALAVLDYGREPVSTGAGSGRLLHLIRPKDL